MGGIGIAIIVVIVGIVLLLLLTATSRKFDKACSLFEEKKYKEAEEILKDIYSKHEQAPAKLASIYIARSSATSKGFPFLKKALELSESDLSEEAKSELAQKKKRAMEVVAIYAKDLYDSRKYEDAVKFISLVENHGAEYKIAAMKYRSRDAALKLDKPSKNNDTLHLLIKDDSGDIVKNEVFAVAKELHAQKEYQRSLWLLELLPTDDKMLELFDSNVIGNLNDHSALLSCNSSRLGKRILAKAEAYTDGLTKYPERQIQLYKAISRENDDSSIFDKIERLVCKKAEGHLKADNYDKFKESFTVLHHNRSVSAPVKQELIQAYTAMQFEYLREAIKAGKFRPEWKSDWDGNIQSYARKERHPALVELAKYLTSKKRFEESNGILVQIDQEDEEVKNTALENVVALIEKEKTCTSIAQVYKNSALLEFLAEKIFSLAQEKSAEGKKVWALHLCQLAEPSITDKKPFYVFLGKLAVEIVLGCKEESTTESLRYALDILKKKECKEIESNCIDSLQKAADQFFKGNEFSKCYFICEQLRSRNESFSNLFIESSYRRCQQNLSVDAKKLQEEIRKKEDQYPDYARFIKYIPEFKEEYLKWTAKFVSRLASSDKSKAVAHFNSLGDDETKSDVLKQIFKIDDALFREVVLSLMAEPKKSLKSQSPLYAELVGLLSSSKDIMFSYTCFKSLLASGFAVKDNFVSVASKRIDDEKDLASRLLIVDDALDACLDQSFLAAKTGIAAQLAYKEPDTSILICNQVAKHGISVNDILLAAYITKCGSSADIKEKSRYLELSKTALTSLLSRQTPSGWKDWSVRSGVVELDTDRVLEKVGSAYVGYLILKASEKWTIQKASSKREGKTSVTEKTGLYKIVMNPDNGEIDSVLIDDYFKLEKNATSLSDAYLRLQDTDNAIKSLSGFPSLACEVRLFKMKLEESKSIPGDAAAIEFINRVISDIQESEFFLCDELEEVFHDLADQLSARTIKKSQKQPRSKAIQTLLELQRFLNGWSFTSLLDQYNVVGLLSDACYMEGVELEEKGDLKEAQKIYHLAIVNGCTQKDFAGRHAICSVKREDLSLATVKGDVNKVKDLLPADLKKDLLYRYVLRLLKAGDIATAESILKSDMRSRNLLELCESCKLRKVKGLMLDFNDKVNAITNGSLGYADANAFLAAIPKLAKPIEEVYPEYRGYFSTLPAKLRPYLIKAAYRSKDFKMVYDSLIAEKKDFISDLTLFRNIAVSCLGLIENNGLTAGNYKDVISIWLSAVFCDALIVKSLDYTSWDDGYTFCLDDSLSQTFEYDDLPDNINFDEPSDTNISIGSVQKSLLERTEGVLSSLDQEYYDFYLQQKAAMTALVDLFGQYTGDAVAPHTIGLLPASYARDLKKRLIDDADDYETGLRVGYLYGFRDDAFEKYNKAFTNYERCLDSARSLTGSIAWGSTAISSIRQFSGLFRQLISEVTSIIQNHVNTRSDYRTLLEPLCRISSALGDRNLTHLVGEYLNGGIAQDVKSDKMTQVDALPLLVKSYLGCKTHTGLKQNSEIVLGNVIGEYIRRGLTVDKTALTEVIATTREYDSHIIEVISDFGVDSTLQKNRAVALLDILAPKAVGKSYDIAKAKDSLEVMSQITSIMEGAKNGTANLASDLKTMYNLYQTHKDHEVVCVVLAQIASACVSVYFFNGQSGGYGVETILNQLLNNRSSKFLEQRHYFRDNLNDMRSKLGATYYQVLGMSDYELNDNGKRLKKALTILDKFCN